MATDIDISSLERLDHMLAGEGSVVWSLTPAGDRALFISPRAATITGHPVEDLSSRPATWLESIHDEDRPRVEQAYKTLKEGGVVEMDYRLVRPDGDVRRIRDRAVLVRDEDGTVLRVDGVATDQTAVCEAVAAVGRLARGVAHDMKNLLFVIRGYATLLADKLGQDQAELQGIRRAVRLAGSLNDQLMALNDGGVAEDVDLARVVRSVAGMLACVLGDRVALTTDVAGPAPLRASPGQMERLILNLALNARDAMHDGGVLDLCVRAGDDIVTLIVSDSGRGCDPATIFEHNGRGLGLSIVREIVTNNSGTIDVASAPGDGTAFTIRLPRA